MPPISVYAPAELKKALVLDARANHRDLSGHCVFLLQRGVSNLFPGSEV